MRTVLARRWYLVVLGLLGTGALCGLTATLIGPTYESSASMALVPGPATIVENGNPLLYLGGLTQARDVLVKSVEADEVMRSFSDVHPGTTIDVLPDGSSSGPLITVSVSAASEQAATVAMADMMTTVSTELRHLQDEVAVPETSRMSALMLARDFEPTVVRKTQMRAVGTALAVGVGLTLFVTATIDGLLLARSARRREREREQGGIDRTGTAPAVSTTGVRETIHPRGSTLMSRSSPPVRNNR